jgi:hypothetical protein
MLELYNDQLIDLLIDKKKGETPPALSIKLVLVLCQHHFLLSPAYTHPCLRVFFTHRSAIFLQDFNCQSNSLQTNEPLPPSSPTPFNLTPTYSPTASPFFWYFHYFRWSMADY